MLYQRLQAELKQRRDLGSLREVGPKAQHELQIEDQGRPLINLSSNDYLGLGHDERLADDFLSQARARHLLLSSSSSRLLTGTFNAHAALEQEIGRAFAKSCLYFNSGFEGNCGVLSALSDKHTLILADKLAHASIIDGMRGGAGHALRFAHNDLNHLERLLKQYAAQYDTIIIVTESVFSMDGDFAPLKELCALKAQYQNAVLYVDEAHAFGLYGEHGLGLCEESGVINQVDLILCTFGKALGSHGACLIASDPVRSYLINTMRPFIFTTALPPLNAAHALYMFRIMQQARDRRKYLQEISLKVRQCAAAHGLSTGGSNSQIIPLIAGSNEAALALSAYFKAKGFYALPIRHPTVPRHQARVRLSLSAALSKDQVQALCNAFAGCGI